jgi:zinc protease
MAKGPAMGPPPGAEAPVRPSGPETRVERTLANGLRVVLEENHAAPLVALQLWVGAGSADEAAAESGAAHMLEHLVLRGAATAEVAAAGGAAAAWTSFDETVFEATLPASQLDAGLRAVAGPVARPALGAADVERERLAIVDEIRREPEDAGRSAAQALFAAAFGAHPYARPVLGSEAAVAALTPERVGAFFRRAWGAANLALVVVGDFDARAEVARIEAAFAGVPKGQRLAARAEPPAARGPRASAVARDTREPHLLLGFRLPPLGDDDLPALELAAAVLGEGRGPGQGGQARLGLELVSNRQLASAARAYTWSSRQAGLLVVDAVPASGRADEAARAALDEVLRLGRQEVPPEELERARAGLERGLARGRETVDGYARKLGLYATVAPAGDARAGDRFLPRLRALSAGDVRAAAAKFLRAADLTVAAIVPGPGAAAEAPRLGKRLQELAEGAETRADRRAAPAAGTAAAEDAARFVLPSGARVIVLRDASAPTVSIEALWPGGLRDEDARTNGATAMLGRLLGRGTRTRSAEQLASELAAMAATLTGFAGRNGLGVRADLLSRHVDRGLELLVDCIRNPAFSDDEMDRARRGLLADQRAQADDQDEAGAPAAFRLFASALWKRHPYRLDPLGSPDALASLTRRRLLDHYRRHHAISGLTVAVVGDVDAARVVAKLQALLADVPAAATPALPPAAAAASPAAAGEPAPAAPEEVFRFVSKEQARVVIGYPGVTLADPDRFALAVLAQILGGPDGRVALDARGKHLSENDVGAFSLEGLDPGAFAVTLACGPDDLPAAVQAARAALAGAAAAPFAADDVARAGRALIAAQAMSLRSRAALASALAAGEAFGQGFRAYQRYPSDVGKVTPADVQRAARRVLVDGRQVVAVVKPAESAPALTRATVGGGGRAQAP